MTALEHFTSRVVPFTPRTCSSGGRRSGRADVLAVHSKDLHLVRQELFGGRVDGDSDPREAAVSPAGREGDPEDLVDSRGSGAGVTAGEPLAKGVLLSARLAAVLRADVRGGGGGDDVGNAVGSGTPGPVDAGNGGPSSVLAHPVENGGVGRAGGDRTKDREGINPPEYFARGYYVNEGWLVWALGVLLFIGSVNKAGLRY